MNRIIMDAKTRRERQKKQERDRELRQRTELKKRRHLNLLKKLHGHYSKQLNACLVSLSKFDKAIKYFIRALKTIRHPDDEKISSLQLVEERLNACADDPEETNTHVIIDAFFKNIKNFRTFRQQIKMNIFVTMKNFPEDTMTGIQKRTMGELEVMLNTWSTLTSMTYDVSNLDHSSVEDYLQYFEDEQELNIYRGVLSVLPKLADMANRIDFLLIKYQM